MSDGDEYYDDDEDYIFYEEGLYGDADDLAEHTMPSPVWLDNNPTFDLDDILDDFLLDDGDEYYDQHISAKRKRKSDESNVLFEPDTNSSRKRPKIKPVSNTYPDIPITVWRHPRHESLAYPVIRDGSGKGVALLKDWKERIRNIRTDTPTRSKGRSSQQTFAVIVERRKSSHADNHHLSRTAKAAQTSELEQKALRNRHEVVAESAASNRKGNDKHVLNPSTTKPNELAQSGRSSRAAPQKRKASAIDDEEDELHSDNKASSKPSKRMKAQTNGHTTSHTHNSRSKEKERNQRPLEGKPAVSTSSSRRRAPLPAVFNGPKAEKASNHTSRSLNSRGARKK